MKIPFITNEQIVREFFTERFGRTPESDLSYYEEWKGRILFNPDPISKMDKKSTKIFIRVLKRYEETTMAKSVKRLRKYHGN